MKENDFTVAFESLTSRQRSVLQRFLAGESDEAIATALYIETSTVRRHLTNICKEFGFSNATGEHYSYRDELRNLFLRFRPEIRQSHNKHEQLKHAFKAHEGGILSIRFSPNSQQIATWEQTPLGYLWDKVIS